MFTRDLQRKDHILLDLVESTSRAVDVEVATLRDRVPLHLQPGGIGGLDQLSHRPRVSRHPYRDVSTKGSHGCASHDAEGVFAER